MSVVTLVSGGYDSSLMAVLAQHEGVEQFPLFLDYGQRAFRREWAACTKIYRKLGLPKPVKMDLRGFGKTIPCGITSRKKNILEDAFLPGRNLLFLLSGASYALSVGADAVMIGLLNEGTHIFPDQTRLFLRQAEDCISFALGKHIRIVAPLSDLFKREVLILAEKYAVLNTYSCHSGNAKPCGKCVSCRELLPAQREIRSQNGRE